MAGQKVNRGEEQNVEGPDALNHTPSEILTEF